MQGAASSIEEIVRSISVPTYAEMIVNIFVYIFKSTVHIYGVNILMFIFGQLFTASAEPPRIDPSKA